MAAVERYLPPHVLLARYDLAAMLRDGFALGLGPDLRARLRLGQNAEAETSRETVFWYRKPDLHVLRRTDQADWQNNYLEEELRALVLALASCYEHAPWVNAPDVSARAGDRVRQLLLAAELGYHVPSWGVTNRAWGLPDASSMVVKRLSTRRIALPQEMRIYTAGLEDSDLESPDFLDGPNLVVGRLRIHAEVRVVVVADQAYAFELPRASDAADYRAEEMDDAWRPRSLPQVEYQRAVAIVERLGLVIACVDLALTNQGYEFLEVNPNGEYNWLDVLVGGDISRSVVRLLLTRIAATGSDSPGSL